MFNFQLHYTNFLLVELSLRKIGMGLVGEAKKKKKNLTVYFILPYLFFSQRTFFFLLEDLISSLDKKIVIKFIINQGIVTWVSQKDIYKHSSCLPFGEFNLSTILIYSSTGFLATQPFLEFLECT